MILDNNALFSDSQAITASAASTNVYDLGAMANIPYNPAGTAPVAMRRNQGKAKAIPLLVQVVEAFNNCTSIKATIEESSDNSTFTSTGVEQTILLADLTVGKKFYALQYLAPITKRYVRIYYTLVGTAPTLGKITAGIVGEVDSAYVG